MNRTIKCIDYSTNRQVQLDFNEETLVSKKYVSDNTETNLYIGPGLVDLQINGFAGVDFNTFPIGEEEFLRVIGTLVKEGVTSFFPTVITNSQSNIVSLLKNIDQLCRSNSIIEDFVEGIHLEGPFISPKDEAKGAHDHKHICAPDWSLFQKFRKASNNRIKIITISAEWDNAPSFIEKCVAENIIVALGHTMANPEQIKAATNAGAKLSTHLGNGAPLKLPRNSNLIFEQLANDNLSSSLIADGFHLSDSFLKVAIKTKQDNAILVSDSTMFANLTPGVYDSHIGSKVHLESNRRLSTFENNKLLAGSAVSLLDCVNYILKRKISNLSQALCMASKNPSTLIKGKSIDLMDKENSDIILFEIKNNTVKILEVIKKRKLVYLRSKKNLT